MGDLLRHGHIIWQAQQKKRTFQLCLPWVLRVSITSWGSAGGVTVWGSWWLPFLQLFWVFLKNKNFLKTPPGGPTYTNFFWNRASVRNFTLNPFWRGGGGYWKLFFHEGSSFYLSLCSQPVFVGWGNVTSYPSTHKGNQLFSKSSVLLCPWWRWNSYGGRNYTFYSSC